MKKLGRQFNRFVSSPGGSIVSMLVLDLAIAGIGGLVANQIKKHKAKQDPLSVPITDLTVRDLICITHDGCKIAMDKEVSIEEILEAEDADDETVTNGGS